MLATTNDPRVIVTSGGTMCLFDDRGQLIGTIAQPVARQPLGPGRETVFLSRAGERSGTAAA